MSWGHYVDEFACPRDIGKINECPRDTIFMIECPRDTIVMKVCPRDTAYNSMSVLGTLNR